MATTETKTTVEQTPAVSTRRKTTAFITTTVVAVALGVVAQKLIDQVTNRVQTAIVPETKTETTVVE
jgi:hypothetical protein